jgi:hypothetical protein
MHDIRDPPEIFPETESVFHSTDRCTCSAGLAAETEKKEKRENENENE